MSLLTSDQLNRLQSILETLSDQQIIWVSGYLYGLINTKSSIQQSTNIFKKEKRLSSKSIERIVLVSSSQTGNARRIAEQLRDDFIRSGSDVVLFNAGEYKFKKIAESKLLILITSTYGEGEPPEESVAFYRYLFSKRASRMENTNFAVFSLGDRSYEHFAKIGKDFDKRFEELGAHRVCDRVDADVDFQIIADAWRKKIVPLFTLKKSMNFKTNKCDEFQKNIFLDKKNVFYSKEFPLIARLLNRQKITSRHSIKDIHHLEIDISDSNISYQPGDALGVWYENDPDLVNEFLELLNFTGQEMIKIKGEPILLSEALKKHYELTQNTSVIVKNIAILSRNKLLLNLFNNKKQLNIFLAKTPIIEMFHTVSLKLIPEDLLKILRPIQPRFYSISSAQSEVGEEIHITVSLVRYQINGRFRLGGASSYLINRLQENDKIRIFIESNDNFRLPKDSNISIIMIGAGTGIAPFRAFMQQRSSDKALGKSWLFFGNLKFIDDFLYQTEWQDYVKRGVLNKINTAWSRDQDHKIYVQDKLLENAAELWSWIQEGAYVYVCGDAKHMARDVEHALITLTLNQSNMNSEQANDFWNEMRVQHRYQRDIY